MRSLSTTIILTVLSLLLFLPLLLLLLHHFISAALCQFRLVEVAALLHPSMVEGRGWSNVTSCRVLTFHKELVIIAYLDVDCTVVVDKGEIEMSEGVWLGHADQSNEMLIGTDARVIRVFDAIRKPKEERWHKDKIIKMTGTPRQPDPSKPGGRIPVRVNFEEAEEGEPIESRQK